MKSEVLEFKYRPKQFRSHLYGGTVGVLIGLIYLIYFSGFTAFIFILYGIGMLVNYYYSKNLSYVVIDNKGIKVNRFISETQL